MHAPQGKPLIHLQRLAADQRTIAERKWSSPSKPRAAQLPCDHGLFSDESSQLDMCEMFMKPTNE